VLSVNSVIEAIAIAAPNAPGSIVSATEPSLPVDTAKALPVNPPMPLAKRVFENGGIRVLTHINQRM
jgi:hypothetical protein